jgi:excisionase family DNA binding protein
MSSLSDWLDRVEKSKSTSGILGYSAKSRALGKSLPKRNASSSSQKAEDPSRSTRRHRAKHSPSPLVRETDSDPKRLESRDELLSRLLDPVLTLEETAIVLNVCPATVRRYTNKGVLPHFRTQGNQRRFRLSQVLSFLGSQQGGLENTPVQLSIEMETVPQALPPMEQISLSHGERLVQPRNSKNELVATLSHSQRRIDAPD